MKELLKICFVILLLVSSVPRILNAEETSISEKTSDVDETEGIVIFNNICEFENAVFLPERFIVKDINDKGTGVYAVYTYLYSDSEYSSDLGFHPSFSTWQGVSGYYFSNSSFVSMSVSLSITYGYFSIEVAASGSSSGFFVAANPNKPSRPYVYGTVSIDYYRVDIYDAVTNQLVSTATQARFNRNNSIFFYSVKYKNA